MSAPAKDDLVVVTGAGGFIAGALVRSFREKGFTRIRAVDKKPLPQWYQHVPGVESLCLDLRTPPTWTLISGIGSLWRLISLRKAFSSSERVCSFWLSPISCLSFRVPGWRGLRLACG